MKQARKVCNATSTNGGFGLLELLLCAGLETMGREGVEPRLVERGGQALRADLLLANVDLHVGRRI